MTEKRYLTIADVNALAQIAAAKLRPILTFAPRVYAIPRGGIPALFAMQHYAAVTVVDKPEDADYLIDDIIDSGSTMSEMLLRAPNAKPVVLINRISGDCPPAYKRGWLVFPWEGDADGGIEDNIRRLLQFIGEDPTRGGLLETPKRVAKAWQEWTCGYTQNPASVLKVFDDGAENVDEMVLVKDVPFFSFCEHHMAPFFGTVSVGYIPNGNIVGLSKINRVVEIFARRLQVQERMTTQIADAIAKHLEPLGVGVIVKARHFCVESRGVRHTGTSTTTSALRGAMKTNPVVREEFLSLVR